jgi:hypothetical protein
VNVSTDSIHRPRDLFAKKTSGPSGPIRPQRKPTAPEEETIFHFQPLPHPRLLEAPVIPIPRTQASSVCDSSAGLRQCLPRTARLVSSSPVALEDLEKIPKIGQGASEKYMPYAQSRTRQCSPLFERNSGRSQKPIARWLFSRKWLGGCSRWSEKRPAVYPRYST